MNKISWSIKELPLSLKFIWKISRNSSVMKTNFLIQVKDQETKIATLGEIAFNVRYGESKNLILSEFERFNKICPHYFKTQLELEIFLIENKFPSSLCFGLESSFTALRAKLANKNVCNYLGLKEINNIKTSFSIPILSENKIEEFIIKYNLQRFKYIKIKIGSLNDYVVINKILKLINVPIRIDANEAFQKSCEVLKFLDKISELKRVEFLEQPLASSNVQEQLLLKKNCPVLLAADESVIRDQIPDSFENMFDIVNIKLMKSGSYQKAISQLQKTRSLGLQTMLGCMIESSLAISCALNLAELVDIFDLDGFLLLKEDPMNYIVEKNGFLNLIDLKEHR